MLANSLSRTSRFRSTTTARISDRSAAACSPVNNACRVSRRYPSRQYWMLVATACQCLAATASALRQTLHFKLASPYWLEGLDRPWMVLFELTLIFNIVIFLVIYLPIYYIFGYNTIITLSLYFISIILSTIFNYKIQTSSQDYYILNKYSLLIMIFITFTFSYLTYYPIENSLFIDSANKKLGLNNYY